ncbi:class I SAM-dependent methyltransferase [Stakelama pacifica]|uniref:Methyltransferase family protein n=1 Tax=Stakelama pacifica TaxID=517720 RepID=A0A4R6FCE7_9SPHN|nr:class I SAM-dependent methyltransferase [Stakelama pacifica]TDN78772.1 methyltransferase family protein [Stakelama pacifica]
MTSRDTTSPLPRRSGTQTQISLAQRLTPFFWFPIQWPWLLRSLSGGSPMRKAALLRELDLCDDALPNLGSWKADIGYLELIVATIRELRPMHVVELGAGASTLVAGRALALNGGGTLHSCDQHGEFVDATSRWLEEHGVAVDLRAAPLVPAPDGWPGQWYDHGALPDRIDLLLIDGPPGPCIRWCAARRPACSIVSRWAAWCCSMTARDRASGWSHTNGAKPGPVFASIWSSREPRAR